MSSMAKRKQDSQLSNKIRRKKNNSDDVIFNPGQQYTFVYRCTVIIVKLFEGHLKTEDEIITKDQNRL